MNINSVKIISHALQLLGVLIQKDSNIKKQFITNDGF